MRAMRVLRRLGYVQGVEGVSPGASLGCILETLGVHHGFHVEKGALKQFVDYNEVEFRGLRHFDGGVLQAQFDHVRGVFAAALQARAQLFPAGGQDEDQDGIGKRLLDLDRALEVDLQHHVGAFGDALFDGLFRGAIAVAMHMGPLDEGVVGHHRIEFGLGHKEVLASVLFLAAGRPGGVRHGGLDTRVQLQQRLHKAGLAGPAGGGHDKQVSWVIHDEVRGWVGLGAYSMFWTCSRICSISTFMSTLMRVSSRAADFEPRVLASRCSSWIRKSSRLPSSPPLPSRRSSSSRCESRRVISSATSMRMAKAVASDRARSWAASGRVLPSVRFMASFQRSRKRWRCCSTSWGTSGVAWAARARSWPMRSCSMVLRRAPSRWRADSSSLTTLAARACTSSALGSRVWASEPPRRITSATLSGVAWGNQAGT